MHQRVEYTGKVKVKLPHRVACKQSVAGDAIALQERCAQRAAQTVRFGVPFRMEKMNVVNVCPSGKDGLLRDKQMPAGQPDLTHVVVAALGFELRIIVVVRHLLIRMLSVVDRR